MTGPGLWDTAVAGYVLVLEAPVFKYDVAMTGLWGTAVAGGEFVLEGTVFPYGVALTSTGITGLNSNCTFFRGAMLRLFC